MRKKYLKNAKTIVVKVGTSTLTYENGLLNFEMIDKLVRQLSSLHNQGKNVVLVTSGAIGIGARKLRLKEKPKTIPEKQAAAATGQGILLHIYEKFFSEYGEIAAQILLTKDDIKDKTRFTNAKNTFNALLEHGVIPIVNENDAIAVHEIKIGDNDTLSALVATIVDADVLILLSDIDGLYDSDPRKNKDAKLLNSVKEVTKEIESCAGISKSKLGTGGMSTKLKAAKIVCSKGIPMIIANGSRNNVIEKALQDDEIGTLFLSTKK